MPEPIQDQWAQWLLHWRHGGDPEQQKAILDQLYPVRDKVLHNARIVPGEIFLDVGTGDGLIAFGALAQVGEQGKVIFSDISQNLLDHCQSVAQQMGVLHRCEFVRASASDLAILDDASVDVVTTRSVLIYVEGKLQAFQEFFRVLKPEGRLSIFEPINRFDAESRPHIFWGYDVTPFLEMAHKVRSVYERLQPPGTDPMLDFDERDLLAFAEKAGFGEIHLELQAEIKPPTKSPAWQTFWRTAPNPKVPTLEEAVRQTLTPGEAEQFEAYLRPLVKSGQIAGPRRSAVAYLWAVKR
jgi:ubiquinone/menaquinone biosynthesis C-methylase UbiE